LTALLVDPLRHEPLLMFGIGDLEFNDRPLMAVSASGA
jgi:hypothetical protein